MDSTTGHLQQSLVPSELQLPDGTVTLMLTDVVGSTELWQDNAQAMAAAVDRHYVLMDELITRHRGVRPVEQGEGDSVVAAFRNAGDAIECGIEVQRKFDAEPWPEGKSVKVRMAIHTGEVLLRDAGNYFGPAIIRCARVRALAHGGQVLVTHAARAVAADAVEANVDFVDLGSHQLKGLDRPERVFQLTHPDLKREFPPLQFTQRVLSNLPTQLSSLVGREQELIELRSAIDSERLVTLTGAGGCGKTRLALEAGSDALDCFAEGVWSVELAAVGDGALVPHAIASVFGLREEFGRPLVETLVEQLSTKQLLLIVDNCEQVLTDAAAVLQQLLEHCPELKIVATSREPLGITGEITWRVPSLETAPAVALFVDRAKQARPGFTPNEAELAIITDIVERLDGIPLGIELAAARVRMMSPERIGAAIDDRFRLLTGGNRTAMPRQQTLEASVAWSYDLLDDTEQMLACRLAVMRGFTLEAAEQIASDDVLDKYAVLDVLTRLVDKSIVQVDYTRDQSSYRFLETVRQFLQSRFVDSGEADTVRERHLRYFVDLSERCEPDLALGDGPALLKELEDQHDNLDNALEFADTSGRRELALRLATALTLFWELQGHLGRGGRWFARLLAQTDPTPTVQRSRACWGAAHIGLYAGDFATMSTRAEEALELAETVDDEWARARALNTVGFATSVSHPSDGRAYLRQSIAIGDAIGDIWSGLNSRKMVTLSHLIDHDEAGAMEALDALHTHAKRYQASYFEVWYHGLTGWFLAQRGDLTQGRLHLDIAIDLGDGINEPITASMSRAWRSSIDIAEGEYDLADREMTSLLQRAHASGGSLGIPDMVVNLGDLALLRGEVQMALHLLETVVEEMRDTGLPYSVVWISTALADARRRAGDISGCDALLDEIEPTIATMGNPWFLARSQLLRGLSAFGGRDFEAAERFVRSSLTTFARMEMVPDIARALEALGWLAIAAQSEAESIRCFAAVGALRAKLGIVAWPVDVAAVDAVLDKQRGAIGQALFDQYWAEGAALGWAEAVEYVSRAHGERKRPATGWASLTPTEQRVVELVTEGLTNPQIAELMFIARGTVKVHLGHIFAKLGVASRSELAAIAARRE